MNFQKYISTRTHMYIYMYMAKKQIQLKMSDENFYNLCHRVKSTAQTVTMKSEERSITEGSYISPPGHLSSIKNIQIKDDETSFDLVSMSGIRMEAGRTWPNSSKIFSRKVILKNNSFDTNNLRVLNSFEITSSNEKTNKGSVIPQLSNPAYVDLEPPESKNLHLVIFGGQSVDKYTTSDDLIVIKGPADLSGDAFFVFFYVFCVLHFLFFLH